MSVEIDIGEAESVEGMVFTTRLPDHIFKVMSSGQGKIVREKGILGVFSHDGRRVGEFGGSMQSIADNAGFDAILKEKNSTSYAPLANKVCELIFKSDKGMSDFAPKKPKKKAVMITGDEILQEPSEPVQIGWSAGRTYKSLRKIRERFDEGQDSCIRMLMEARLALNSNPGIFDSARLRLLSEDLQAFKKDAGACVKIVQKLAKCIT
jgi:hypothetical protein